MNIIQLIQTLVATVVGGLIVIATNWLTARGKRREAVQDWYERTYITEGIDPLVAYYQRLVICLIDKSRHFTLQIDQKEIPVEALTNIRILLKNSVTPLNIIFYAQAILTYLTDSKPLYETSVTLQNDVITGLMNFRRELIEVVTSKVHDKHYLADTTDLISQLKKAEQKLSQRRSEVEMVQKVQLDEESHLT